MFKSQKLGIPKNYRPNISRDYPKKKRPFSKKANHINALYNNDIFNNKTNNFSITKNKFHSTKLKKDSILGYIKDDQQYNKAKIDLLKIKGSGKDNFIRQIDKGNDKKLKYLLKNNEKKSNSTKKQFNLINYNYNMNGIPIKLMEFEKN